MNISTKYLKLFAICAFASVITTVGIHSSLFDIDMSSYDNKIQLYESFKNSLSKWWIIVHCLLVLVTMWGIWLLRFNKSHFWMSLGFIFYAVFAFVEIFRQFLELFYLNGLINQYETAETMEIKGYLITQIESFNLISHALFGLFIFAFAFENVSYGVALINGKKWDSILGVLLLIWGVLGLLILGNEFWNIDWLGKFLSFISFVYQPMVRFTIGVWFVFNINKMINLKTKIEPESRQNL